MSRRSDIRSLVLAAVLPVVFAVVWAGGCTNDPFDPASVPNHRPVARIFVAPTAGDSLNATSYFRRTFHWSGSDEDGFVVAYYVSIETQAGAAAPWDTTTRTDTTMTFTTDDQGRAMALIRVACVDDRGAVSDTVSQFIPLRNFPPVINFVSDYDTLRWSYRAADFRCFALDLDGQETMDDSVVYYLDTADTTLAPVPFGSPGADPNDRPVRKALDDPAQGLFEIDLYDIRTPGLRTLTILVGDEADATARFTWQWEVFPAVGPVLLVDDFPGSFDAPAYYAAMDSLFGPGGWSLYDLDDGLPDRLWILTETFRQFQGIVWYTAAGTSSKLIAAADAITEFVQPTEPEQVPGRLLLVSAGVIGGSQQLPPSFVTEVLGIGRTPTQPTFYIPSDKTAIPVDETSPLPVLHFVNSVSAGVGLQPLVDSDPLYHMEYYLFWSRTRRPPYEPYVVVRHPSAALAPSASAVTVALQLEYVQPGERVTILRHLLQDELGVIWP